jgi:hypothetical protein
MTNRIQTLRSSTAGNRPSGRQPGELYVNWPDGQLGVINAASAAQDLIAIRFFSTTANYGAGDFVAQGGQVFRAKVSITAGPFVAANWDQVALGSNTALYLPLAGGTMSGAVLMGSHQINNLAAPTNPNDAATKAYIDAKSSLTIADTAPSSPKSSDMWWDSVGGQLYVYYNDGNSSQWVVANAFNGGPFLALGGGTMTGDIVLKGNATASFNPVPLQQLNSAIAPLANYLPLAGGTVTGNLNVNGGLVALGNNLVVQQTASNNPLIQIQSSLGSGLSQYYYNATTGAVVVNNVPQGAAISLATDVNAIPASGHNFVLSPGLGYQSGGGAWQSLSDARIKTVQGDYAIGLTEVLALRPVEYVYKGNDALPGGQSIHEQVAADGTVFVGFVAQEAEQVFPGMVREVAGMIDGVEVDDLRTLDVSPLVYALVNAVKTLVARIEALEAAR